MRAALRRLALILCTEVIRSGKHPPSAAPPAELVRLGINHLIGLPSRQHLKHRILSVLPQLTQDAVAPAFGRGEHLLFSSS
jgi:hypothetical protein